MKAVLIDDELPCLTELAFLLRKYPDIEVTGLFSSAAEALDKMECLRPDAVFLDIDMPRMNGLELALRIQALCAGVVVVFVTAYPQYALDAFKVYPLDYLLKPVKEARLDACVDHLRGQYALLHPAGEPDRIHIQCFGSFRVDCGHEIRWGTHRVREMLLYLIGRRGAAATRDELAETLFSGLSGKSMANNLYVTLYRLRNVLAELNRGGNALRLTDDCALSVAPGVCDYTDFMDFAQRNGSITEKNAVEAARALHACAGPYLENEGFEWAAEAAGIVEEEYERIALGLAGVHLNAGRLPEAEAALNRLIARNPLCDEGYALLLELHMRGGNRAAYAALYEQYDRMLRKEFRLKPKERFRQHYLSVNGRHITN